jgi:beta-galactosidase
MFRSSKLRLFSGAVLAGLCALAYADTQYSMDPGWKFIKQDVSGAQATGFADSSWSTVSTPHTYNDVDSYTKLINHSSGDVGSYTGPAWYRKHFKIPSQYSGGKVIVEFERIRQGAQFYINGVQVGVYDDGVTACGIDLTGKVNFGATDNVLAVRVDNSSSYVETSTGVGFEWNGKAFNPNYGGLIGHVWLHLPGLVYQTFPLYNNLQTSGIYVYPSNFSNVSPSQGSLTVNVQSQVRNESGSSQTVTLTAQVIDPASQATVATFQSSATPLANGGTSVLSASGALANAKLWSDVTPNLYNVVTNLTVGGTIVDSRTTVTGFRQTAFRGGAGTGGVFINGRFVYLLGFAQRSSNDWAALGEAVPDWMHDFHANLIKGSNSNYIRWMHITPQRIDVAANDKAGIVNIAPAGDKETDVTGVQWTQRTNVMRASMIYLRNNPSVLFWEAGNNGITAAHMQEMNNLKTTWDPNGGRASGCRDLSDAGGAPYSQYFGTMVAYSSTWTPANDADYFRGYSNNYRNQSPIIECEDERDEAARRFWDKFSPPHYGFTAGANDTYHWDSESIITGDSTTSWQAAITRLNIWLNLYTIRNTSSATSRYAGYASIYFADSNADGRQDSSEVCRVSGKVDAVRLPKELYYAHQVVGNTQPAIHIIGHWTYPAGTTKTIYVVANTPSVELFVNGVSKGKTSTATDHYLFSFPSIAWQSGTIKAVGYNSSGTQVCSYQLQTVGAPNKIKLTPTVGPNGLKADGADIAMFDVEVLDSNGQRCPTDEARVDFSISGPGIWRGGYNSGIVGSINNMYLNTECGINRVFVRSTLTAGTITVMATRSGLTSATASVISTAVPVVDGLLPVGTPPPPTVPPAPTGLKATAGNAQVSLSWSAASGATSYNVKRATVSGGPYTNVATGVTATSYTNTGLSNGTTYYYVVSGVNSVGEGANSTQVSATPTTTTATVYQSENGTWDSGGVIETLHTGYTGTGYVNTGNAIGAYSEVTVNVATAGTYTLDFRYANGGTVDRPADLRINGTVVQAGLSFPITANWDTWSDVIVTKALNAGNNTVRLTATTANGTANLDKVTVQ